MELILFMEEIQHNDITTIINDYLKHDKLNF